MIPTTWCPSLDPMVSSIPTSPSTCRTHQGSPSKAPTGRGHRVKSIGRMKASIQAEQNVDNEGNLIVKRARQPRHSQKGTARASRTASVASTPAPMDIDTDCSDSDFAGDPSDDDTEDSSMGNISNGEVSPQHVLFDSLSHSYVLTSLRIAYQRSLYLKYRRRRLGARPL